MQLLSCFNAWLTNEKNFSKVLKIVNWNETFDYPNYFGLPDSIASNLMSDEVDALQDWKHLFYVPYLLSPSSNDKEVTLKKELKTTTSKEEFHVLYGNKDVNKCEKEVLYSLGLMLKVYLRN